VGLGRPAGGAGDQGHYSRVFTVFGAVTLAIVGIYLLWRSRQAEMSVAMTTAAWALLVMVGRDRARLVAGVQRALADKRSSPA
jgi:Flp pilus assembly protein TadB